MARKFIPHYWPFVKGIHRWSVVSSHKGPVMRSFDLALLYVWMNCGTNSWFTSDLRHHDAYVTSLQCKWSHIGNFKHGMICHDKNCVHVGSICVISTISLYGNIAQYHTDQWGWFGYVGTKYSCDIDISYRKKLLFVPSPYLDHIWLICLHHIDLFMESEGCLFCNSCPARCYHLQPGCRKRIRMRLLSNVPLWCQDPSSLNQGFGSHSTSRVRDPLMIRYYLHRL